MVEGRNLLPALREQIGRIERPAATMHGVLPFGVAQIDRALPGGGLARGALHEILGAGGDEEDGALAAAFTAGIVGRLAAGPHPNPPPWPRGREGPLAHQRCATRQAHARVRREGREG